MASLIVPSFPPISQYVQADVLRHTISQLPQYGSFDDFAAVAVVTTLTMLFLLRGVVWDRPDPFLHKMFERPQENMGSVKKNAETRDIREKLDAIGADIVIFWGSQSGTAERFANRLSKEIAQRFGKKALAADCSDYEPDSIKKLTQDKLAIFIASTFGEGEPSDNINDLWSWLHTAKGSPLTNLKYAAFGLGNSKYKYYNAVIDYVVDRLDKLGAQAVLSVGRADDAKGETEEHYLDWKESLFNLFTTEMGFDAHDPIYEPSISVIQDDSVSSENVQVGQVVEQTKNKFTARKISPVHALPVKEARELFNNTEGGRNCIHMELDLNEHPGLRYKTGDHLGIWPVNPSAEVDGLVRSLGIYASKDTPIAVSSLQQGEKLKVPSPTTPAALFANYLEICAPVSRETIASLAQFAPTEAAKAHLTRLSTDKKAHQQLIESTYINLGRLLQLVAGEAGAWAHLPLSFVIESLPAMQQRWYSISSSSVVHARQIAITAVVNDNTLAGSDERVPGLCTNYLLAAKNESAGTAHPRGHTYSALPDSTGKVFAQLRKSTFKLPANAAQPIIMVGAGTGIAPFRGFLQERARLRKMGRPVGKTIFFFGCRNENQDYIYRDELAQLQQALGESFELHTAFSRPDAGSKVYVQDRVGEHGEKISGLVLDEDANFYICGSAAMARDVGKVVGEELSRREHWDDEGLRVFMERQKRLRRWQQDVWG